jgi:hypothetical protein
MVRGWWMLRFAQGWLGWCRCLRPGVLTAGLGEDDGSRTPLARSNPPGLGEPGEHADLSRHAGGPAVSPRGQRCAHRTGRGAPADVQRLAGAIGDDPGDPSIAGDPAKPPRRPPCTSDSPHHHRCPAGGGTATAAAPQRCRRAATAEAADLPVQRLPARPLPAAQAYQPADRRGMHSHRTSMHQTKPPPARAASGQPTAGDKHRAGVSSPGPRPGLEPALADSFLRHSFLRQVRQVLRPLFYRQTRPAAVSNRLGGLVL